MTEASVGTFAHDASLKTAEAMGAVAAQVARQPKAQAATRT
jgi:hypothetical protein